MFLPRGLESVGGANPEADGFIGPGLTVVKAMIYMEVVDHETYGWYIGLSCFRHCPPISSYHYNHQDESTHPRPVMNKTLTEVISNRCFICKDEESRSTISVPSLPDVDVQFSDAEPVVVNEILEDVGLALVEVPRYMIPRQFAAEYDHLRGYASLDIFEDLRSQATYFPFMPVNYIHWLDSAIPLSRFFFVDGNWISWGDAKGWNQEDQRQYEEWNAEEGHLSIDTESLDAQDDYSYDPRSPFKRPSRVPPGLLSMPSEENMKRRRTIYYARPPLVRATATVGDKFGRIKWPSTSSLSSASKTSQLTRDNPDGVRRLLHIPGAIKLERLRRAFHVAE